MRVKTMLAVTVVLTALVPIGGCNGTAGVVGNDEFLGLRLMQRGETRTRAGVELDWSQGVEPGDVEAVGLSGLVTYDLVKDAPFKVLDFEVPVTWSVGGKAGAWYVDGRDLSPGAALLTQVMFGDADNRLGLEISKAVDWDFWGEPFTQAPSDVKLMLNAEHRFK
jgi:hypothetical protein